MKLKQHRNDVKNLRKQADAYIWEVAARYQRLILAFEDEYSDIPNLEYSGSKRVLRVLRDADVHKS